jgi:hypothetical protein
VKTAIPPNIESALYWLLLAYGVQEWMKIGWVILDMYHGGGSGS